MLELLCQRRHPGALDTYPISLARRLRDEGRWHVLKNYQHHPPQRLRLRQSLDGDIHDLRPAVGSHTHLLDGDFGFLPDGLVKGFIQRNAQPLAGHGKHI